MHYLNNLASASLTVLSQKYKVKGPMCGLCERAVVHAWMHLRYHAANLLPRSSEGDSLAVQRGGVLLLLLELQAGQCVANESGLGPRAVSDGQLIHSSPYLDLHTTLQRHNPYAGGGGGTEGLVDSSSLSCNPSSSSLAKMTRIGLCGCANPFSTASLRFLPVPFCRRACRASMQSRIR